MLPADAATHAATRPCQFSASVFRPITGLVRLGQCTEICRRQSFTKPYQNLLEAAGGRQQLIQAGAYAMANARACPLTDGSIGVVYVTIRRRTSWAQQAKIYWTRR